MTIANVLMSEGFKFLGNHYRYDLDEHNYIEIDLNFFVTIHQIQVGSMRSHAIYLSNPVNDYNTLFALLVLFNIVGSDDNLSQAMIDYSLAEESRKVEREIIIDPVGD